MTFAAPFGCSGQLLKYLSSSDPESYSILFFRLSRLRYVWVHWIAADHTYWLVEWCSFFLHGLMLRLYFSQKGLPDRTMSHLVRRLTLYAYMGALDSSHSSLYPNYSVLPVWPQTENRGPRTPLESDSSSGPSTLTLSLFLLQLPWAP